MHDKQHFQNGVTYKLLNYQVGELLRDENHIVLSY